VKKSDIYHVEKKDIIVKNKDIEDIMPRREISCEQERHHVTKKDIM